MTKYIAMLAVSLLYASCVSTLVWDDKRPATETASVYWHFGLHPTVCNGIAIEQQKIIGGGTRSPWEIKNVVLPAGDIEIELNLDAYIAEAAFTTYSSVSKQWTAQQHTVRYKGAGFVFRYHLDPETQYVFMFARNEKNHWGVNIYDRPSPTLPDAYSYPNDKENFIEFVPFIKQPRHIKPLLLGGSEAVL
jgi:hypothetical protein